MTPERKPKPWWLGAIFVVIGIAILLTLGTWQVQRLKWKEGLLARIAALQEAPAVPLQSIAGRPARDLDFVRVSLDCPDIQSTSQWIRLYTIHDGEAAHRLLTDCPVGHRGFILVDTGVVAADWQEPPPAIMTADAARAERERRRLREPLIGVLRIPSAANAFTPKGTEAGILFSLDLADLQRDPRFAGRLMPVVLMLEHPRVGPATPAPLPNDIPNRHLEYALTWYGLAAALAGVYIALLLRRRSSKT